MGKIHDQVVLSLFSLFSWKKIEALGGMNIRDFFDDENAHCIVRYYEIDVNESISNNSAIYEPMTEHITLRKYTNNDYRFVLFLNIKAKELELRY